MQPKRKFSLSLKIALRGAIEALLQERNLKIQWLVGALVVVFGAWLRLEVWEWSILVLSIGAVLAAELMNTAIESVVDLLHPDLHESARKAKDFAAGGVLVMSFSAAIVGLLIFGKRLLEIAY